MPKSLPVLKTVLVGAVLATAACSSHYDRSPKEIAERHADPLVYVDQDMMQVLSAQQKLGTKPIETLSPTVARIQPTPADAVMKLLKENGKDPMPKMGVDTRMIPIAGGAGMIQAKVYTPEGAKKSKEALPVIVYYHGGGWVIATVNTYDSSARGLSKMVNAVVVSVEYRKAPEHKFPAAHDDAFAAYKWVLANAKSLGGDPSRVAVVGESAGGNLAINTAIKARDAGIRKPVYEALIYPVAGVNMNTESYVENANAKPLNKAMMGWFVKNTIRSQADLQDPRLDIIGKANLRNLPGTTIITAEIDPLRTDGELLAKKLEQSGVKVNYKTFEGVTHEFFGMSALIPEAVGANMVVVKDLKAAFAK